MFTVDKLMDGFDEFMNAFSDEFESMNNHSQMKCDVYEKDGNYLMEVDLPGFDRNDISLTLNDGYLVIKAQRHDDHETKDDKGTLIRSERYYGELSRSFYVGDGVKEDDIKAKFENGVLKCIVPKVEKQQIVENQTICIE